MGTLWESLTRTRKRRAGLITTAVFVLFAGVGLAMPASAAEATIERGIDGDTVDVTLDGRTVRVRILNIDTPESVDPDKPKECLSEEATAVTKSLLEPGAIVRLEFDREREDRYGRTLAHVKLSDGRYVSDELARRGLGVPVHYGKNDDRLDDVKSAFSEAYAEQLGFFDPDEECTLASTLQAASVEAASARQVETGTAVATAVAALATLKAMDESQEALRESLALARKSTGLAAKAYRAIDHGDDIDLAVQRLDSITTRHAEVKELLKDLEKAEEEAKQKARAERVEKAERLAAERAEDAKKPTPEKSSSSDGDYSGYTGPRCYAPGGKTWKPC